MTEHIRKWWPRARRSLGLLPVLFGAVWGGGIPGCAPSQGAASPNDTRSREPRGEAPAMWAYHPLEKAPSRARLRLDAQRVLEVDDAGGRWLLTRGKSPRPTAFGAPEPLVGVEKYEGGYFALGEGGAVYFFSEPLGAFHEIRTPPQPFARAVVAGPRLVAISKDGHTFVSDDVGRSWNRSVREAFFAGIAATEGGVIAYSVPEQWHISTDGGDTFRRLVTPSLAPRELRQLANGKVVAEGLFDTVSWDGSRFVPYRHESTSSAPYAIREHARASMISGGQGGLRDERFLALLPYESDDRKWKLLTGTLDLPLEVRDVERPAHCERYRVAVSADSLLVVCQDGTADVTAPLFVYWGKQDANRLNRLSVTLRGKLSDMALSLGPNGAVALAGGCSKLPTESACLPRGVVLLSGGSEATSDDERVERWIDLPGVPYPTELAHDEKGHLWAAARRSKDGAVLLYGPIQRSTTVPRLLDLSRQAHLPQVDDPQQLSMFVGSSVIKSVAVRSGDRVTFATVGPEGNLLGVGEAPSGATLVAGAGRFLAALDLRSEVLHTSDSGGLAWERRELPRALCRTDQKSDCDPSLQCSEAGCLLGDELVLVGWGRGSRSSRSQMPLSSQASTSDGRARGLRCQLGDDPWSELSGLMQVPSGRDVGLGEAAWVQATSFPHEAAVSRVRALWNGNQVERTEMLAPVAYPSDYAFAVVPQVEGTAAFRYRIPSRLGGGSQASVELQVAWDNELERVLTQSRVNDTLSFGHLRSQSRAGMSEKATPELLSVAGNGLYLELGSSGLGDAPVYFFVPGEQPSRVSPLSWSAPGMGAHGWFSQVPSHAFNYERAHVAGQHGGFLRLEAGAVLVRYWDSPHEGWTYSPYLMGLLHGSGHDMLQSVQIAYLGSRVGFVSMQVDPRSRDHRAHFVALGQEKAFEDPIPVPLLADLPPEPKLCTQRQRTNTPRVYAPSPTGPRRAVRITGLSAVPVALETSGATLFGDKQSPCVAAWEAVPSSRATTDVRIQALVFPGPDQPSWLFRTETTTRGGALTSARPMVCTYEASSG